VGGAVGVVPARGAFGCAGAMRVSQGGKTHRQKECSAAPLAQYHGSSAGSLSPVMKKATGKPTSTQMRAEMLKKHAEIEELMKKADKEEALADEAIQAARRAAREKDARAAIPKKTDKEKLEAAKNMLVALGHTEKEAQEQERRARIGLAPKAKSKPKAKSAPCKEALEVKEDAEEEDEESWGGWSEKGFREKADQTKSFEIKVTNVEGHTHEYLKEIITRFGYGAQPFMKSKEGKDTAVLTFRTVEEATSTLAAGAHHVDDLWPNMKWSWKAFDAFENVYTKNPKERKK
jgi:hypothetical protein